MSDDLAREIAAAGFNKHLAFLMNVAKPSVNLLETEGAAIIGGSKFGGSPDLPADFEWPEGEFGPYRFLGQFNFKEIPDGPSMGLPADGLLSLFFVWDEDGHAFWRDPHYVRGFRFDPSVPLKSIEPPSIVAVGKCERIECSPGWSLPKWPDLMSKRAWPIEKELREPYDDLLTRLRPTGRYLLGHPYNPTLAYDPEPGPAWRTLLTLVSDHDMWWEWHDSDWLVTFVEDDRLRASDFAEIKADAG
jgi:uncharacterized protein YwqG